MTQIVSKRSFTKFYLIVFIGAAGFIALAVLFFFIYNNTTKGRLEQRNTIAPMLSAACCFLSGYTMYRYFKNAPIVAVNDHEIYFNRQVFLLTDIKIISLAGKQSFKYLGNHRVEGASITLNNGKTKYIFDDMYSNTWEIKSFLQQVFIDKKSYRPISLYPIDNGALAGEAFETFKGNQFTSFTGILLWGSILSISYMLWKSHLLAKPGLICLVFCYSFVWLSIFSNRMHYFQLSGRYLLVRNHNFFWKRKAYHLSEIREIVFEQRYRMPNSLRVITADFKTKLYPAGTLWDKTWLAMKSRLEASNIKVRNECI